MIRNQVQIFSVMNCIEASEVTHLASLFIIIIYLVLPNLRSLSQKTTVELKIFQYSKENQHLVPKSQKIPINN